MTPIEVDRIRFLLTNFKNRTFGNEPQDHMCLAVCCALFEHLKNNSITPDLVQGGVNGKGHYWLQYNYYIIDVALEQKQFNLEEDIKSPLFQPLPIPYYYDENPKPVVRSGTEIDNAFELFKEPLLNGNKSVCIFKPPKDMIPYYIRFLIRAGVVLLEDARQNNSAYFDFVFSVCDNYTEKGIDGFFEQLPTNWEKFNSKYKEWQSKKS